MEWLYGILIGVAWGAGFMSFVHWAHEQEKVEKTESAERIEKGLDKPKPVWDAAHVVEKLEDVPTGCICDWHGDQRFCEAEPGAWYLGLKDPQCPVHAMTDYEEYYWTHRRDL